MAIVNPNAGFQIAYQQGFLARFFEEGLDSLMAYRRDAKQELIPVGAGETITKTRYGRLAPVPTPLNPANVIGLDNGVNYVTANLEQYTYNVNEYTNGQQLDLLYSQMSIGDQLLVLAKNNGVNAAQTIERVAKQTWFASYNTGNTWARGDLGSLSDTQLWVDDIRGFQFAPVNGSMQPVSSSNQLLVNEYAFSGGGVTQSFYVTAAVADSPTRSVYPSSVFGQPSDGISGYLTITGTSTAPVSGDAIISSLATPVIRPNGKQGTNQLGPGDQLTLQLINNAVAVLEQNAIPRHSDGCYHLYYDFQSQSELFIDQQFILASASRIADTEYQNGQIFSLYGTKFIPTTEAYLQALNTSAGMQTPAAGGTNIHRVLITGAEGLNQGNFAGLESYAEHQGVGQISNIFMVDNVAHIIRSPIDNQGRSVTLVWLAAFGMVCPTDLTATPATIPTANNATFKRAIVIEHC